MSRRVTLPGAAELFRVTGDADVEPPRDAGAGDSGGSGPRALRETTIAEDLDNGAAAAGNDAGWSGEQEGQSPSPALGYARPHEPRRPGGAPVTARVDTGPDRAEDQDWASRERPVRRRARVGDRQPTGRERHEEKITVYCSPEELLDLEHARLTLRGDFGLAVDRGRIVREAMAVVLADLDAKGESSILVRRLRGRA